MTRSDFLSKSWLTCFMALVRDPGNGFTRIMLSLLVLFAIDFPWKCFTVGSPTIIVQGLFWKSINKT